MLAGPIMKRSNILKRFNTRQAVERLSTSRPSLDSRAACIAPSALRQAAVHAAGVGQPAMLCWEGGAGPGSVPVEELEVAGERLVLASGRGLHFRAAAGGPSLEEWAAAVAAAGGTYAGERSAAGLREGVGTHTLAGGGSYVGQWRRGLREGRGTLRRSDGEMYEGAFRAGRREGAGCSRFAGGDVYEGASTLFGPRATSQMTASGARAGSI